MADEVPAPVATTAVPFSVTKSCGVCSQEFTFTGRQASQVKYCSPDCRAEAIRRAVRKSRSVCPHCHKTIEPVRKRKRR